MCVFSLEEIQEDAPPKAFDLVLLAYKPSTGALGFSVRSF